MASKRFLALGGTFGFLWLALIGRVFQVQILEADHYRGLAEGQSLRRDVLVPRRGEIFDRDGKRLVVNVESAPVGKEKGAAAGFRWSRLDWNSNSIGP
jgi:cell division protein FtsI/penicillin-binding protein 2